MKYKSTPKSTPTANRNRNPDAGLPDRIPNREDTPYSNTEANVSEISENCPPVRSSPII